MHAMVLSGPELDTISEHSVAASVPDVAYQESFNIPDAPNVDQIRRASVSR